MTQLQQGVAAPPIPMQREGQVQMKVLIIEDDAQTRHFLAKGLREAGHVVDEAIDGEDGLHQAMEGSHDVAVIDRMLPHLDGLSIIRELRSCGRSTPILILSALGDIDDRVSGLRAGGDDQRVAGIGVAGIACRLERPGRKIHRGDHVLYHFSAHASRLVLHLLH